AIITRCDLVADHRVRELRERIAGFADVPVFESVHRPLWLVNSEDQSEPLETAANQPIAAFCGLGNPDAFREMLVQLGMAPTRWKTFPDHHSYTRQDVEALEAWAAELPNGGFILTTQKDLVKLRVARLGGRPLWAVKIGLEFRDGEARLRQ